MLFCTSLHIGMHRRMYLERQHHHKEVHRERLRTNHDTRKGLSGMAKEGGSKVTEPSTEQPNPNPGDGSTTLWSRYPEPIRQDPPWGKDE